MNESWDGPPLGATANRVVSCSFWAANVAVPLPSGLVSQQELECAHEAIVRSCGSERYAELVGILRSSGRARRVLWREQRGHWWVIRNHRACDPARVKEVVWQMFALDFLLQDAGVDVETVRRLNACASHGCVCDGCDLWDGERLEREAPGDPRSGEQASV